MRLQGKVALVTGANSQGIGRAIALRFAQEGADVAVNYVVNDQSAQAVVEEIRAMGRRAVAVKADVSQRSQVEAMVEQAVAELGPIDALVNNAGTISQGSFLEITDEMIDRVIATNLKGTYIVGQVVARQMVKRGKGGTIVNVASTTVRKPPKNLSHYSATKGGIWTLTRAMAVDLLEYGIRVNSISPGTFLTDINRHKMVDPAFYKLRTDPIPMKRLGEPHEMAGAAVYLSCDDSSFVTGIDILVDGGTELSPF